MDFSFKGRTALRLYKSFGDKGLRSQQTLVNGKVLVKKKKARWEHKT
jgi:hypothetical protein